MCYLTFRYWCTVFVCLLSALFSSVFSCFLFLYCMSDFVFFFFKQKTAYEMRISDWSSDVCSPDLARVVMVAAIRCGDERRLFARDRHVGAQVDIVEVAERMEGEQAAREVVDRDPGQIGRASCRESVGQYVENALAAVSLKKHGSVGRMNSTKSINR